MGQRGDSVQSSEQQGFYFQMNWSERKKETFSDPALTVHGLSGLQSEKSLLMYDWAAMEIFQLKPRTENFFLMLFCF